MNALEALLKDRLGTGKYWLLRKALEGCPLHLYADAGEIVVYRDGNEPLTISFEFAEAFVNNVCQQG